MTDKERALEIIDRSSKDEIAAMFVGFWKEIQDKTEYIFELAERMRGINPSLSDEIVDFVCSWGGGA